MPTSPTSTVDPLTIRLARDRDGAELWRLATLDSADVPAGPVLIAEVDGRAVAAVALADGAAIADPFHPTAGLVELLRVRAAELRRRSPTPTHHSRRGVHLPHISITRSSHDALARSS